MIQNTLFCKRARAAAGGRKQALVLGGYAARLLCHYITLRGGAQARQRQRKTLWGHGMRPQGRGRRGLRPRRPAPTGQRSPPGAAEGARANEVSARARDRVRDRARGICCEVPAAQRGGQPRRTAGKRRTQQCAGAAALLCRHAGARAPTAEDVPTTEGGAHRRP